MPRMSRHWCRPTGGVLVKWVEDLSRHDFVEFALALGAFVFMAAFFLLVAFV